MQANRGQVDTHGDWRWHRGSAWRPRRSSCDFDVKARSEPARSRSQLEEALFDSSAEPRGPISAAVSRVPGPRGNWNCGSREAIFRELGCRMTPALPKRARNSQYAQRSLTPNAIQVRHLRPRFVHPLRVPSCGARSKSSRTSRSSLCSRDSSPKVGKRQIMGMFGMAFSCKPRCFCLRMRGDG